MLHNQSKCTFVHFDGFEVFFVKYGKVKHIMSHLLG
jgi:hypothetical protein